MALSSVVVGLKDVIVATIKGTSDVLTALRGAVKDQVVGGVNDVGDVVEAAVISAKDVERLWWMRLKTQFRQLLWLLEKQEET